MNTTPFQKALFEEDYLLRELGSLAHEPQVALTELVANSWDAGASEVKLILPEQIGGTLAITDDGHGMTPEEFKKRWMTLGYNRERHQGLNVQFPPDRKAKPRRAYGRNGVGRHGLLCFANQYQVQTWRNGTIAFFTVGTKSDESPFVLLSEALEEKQGAGTRLEVIVERNLPNAEDILAVLATRFVHDPDFVIQVNGKQLSFDELEDRVSEKKIELSNGRSAIVSVLALNLKSNRLKPASVHQGVAFWVQRRLVGTPSWSIGTEESFDGRTYFARNYKVIVDTSGFEKDVDKNWTAFVPTDAVRQLYRATADHIKTVAQHLSKEIAAQASEDALMRNRHEFSSLGPGTQREVLEFTNFLAKEHPTIAPDFLYTAVNAVIHLQKSNSGAALLQKLTQLPANDIDKLNKLLEEWTINDAEKVLDEIHHRLSVIETIRRFSSDPDIDELHQLHPLILRSRWLFGPEFESSEYRSNSTLRTIARNLFNNAKANFQNDDKRPDIVVAPKTKTSIQLTGVENFDPSDPTIVRLDKVLIIELKRGGFTLTSKEIHQANDYVKGIKSGSLPSKPYICCWVVGQKISQDAETDMKLGDPEYGRTRAITFDFLVDTANQRLHRLRDTLKVRYDNTPTEALLQHINNAAKERELDF